MLDEMTVSRLSMASVLMSNGTGQVTKRVASDAATAAKTPKTA